MRHFERDEDSPEVKEKGRTQRYVLGKVSEASRRIMKSLRELSAKTAQELGHLDSVVDNALDPYFSLVSAMGFSGGSTTLPDGRHLYVSLRSCHYGISDDKISITLSKGEKFSEEFLAKYEASGRDYSVVEKEWELSKLEITAKPGQLDYNAVAMALRVIADTIDTDQYVKGANGDGAAFSIMVERFAADKKEAYDKKHFNCPHEPNQLCPLDEKEEELPKQ